MRISAQVDKCKFDWLHKKLFAVIFQTIQCTYLLEKVLTMCLEGKKLK